MSTAQYCKSVLFEPLPLMSGLASLDERKSDQGFAVALWPSARVTEWERH